MKEMRTEHRTRERRGTEWNGSSRGEIEDSEGRNMVNKGGFDYAEMRSYVIMN